MTAAPPVVIDPLSRPATRFAVFMGDDQGEFAQGLSDRVDWLLLQQIRLGCGTAGLDTVSFAVDLDAAGWRYQDTTTPVGHNRVIEVRRINPTTGAIGNCILWGKLESQSQWIGAAGETLSLVASPRSLLRGEGLGEMPVYDGIKNTIITSFEEWVFNPEIDGLAEPNQAVWKDGDGVYTFAHPESFRTKNAQDAQGVERAFWRLAEAVQRVCWSLNPSEDYLTNPTIAELDAVIETESDALFRNHRLRLDMTLPEALDSLLNPYGYTWHLTYAGAIGDITTKLQVIRLGDGVKTDLRLQRIGDSIDANKTNTVEVSTEWDIVAHPNVILAYAAPTIVESTWDLIPGWNPDPYRNYAWEQLQADGVPREVGHKWVLNSEGSYDAGAATTDGNLLSTATLPHLSRRRKFEPCLTLADDAQPIGDNGFDLRWQGSTDTELKKATWGFSVLNRELGIMIEGKVPYQVWATYKDGVPMMDVTAAIETEHRVSFRADRREESPNGADVVMIVDLSHKFGRKIVLGGDGAQQSRHYNARHAALLDVTAGAAGLAIFHFDRDVSDDIKPGQKIAVLSWKANKLKGDSVPTRFEGTYTAKVVNLTDVTIEEPIATGQAQGANPIAWCGFNTGEEDCLYRMQQYVERMRDEQDYAVVRVNATLQGVDHAAYQRGQLVTGLQPRNVTLNARGGDNEERFPQILSISLELVGGQRTRLEIEQHVLTEKQQERFATNVEAPDG